MHTLDADRIEKDFAEKDWGGPGEQRVVSQWRVLVVKKINSILRCINNNAVSKLGEFNTFMIPFGVMCPVWGSAV